MSSQYLTNLNPPPPQSLLEYDIEPGVVFISTTTEQLFVNLIITVTNTTGAVVDCMQFQFGFLAGALAGNLTTVDQAASVTASSDQSEWRITASGFSENNPHLYLFTATPSGVDEFLTLALMARFASQGGDDYASKLLAMMRKGFGGHAVQSAPERGG